MTPQELKSSILLLAIQGKLVEQRPEEGTGEALFHQLQMEKHTLIKSGKAKKGKALPPITDEDILFNLPSNWYWVRLGELIRVIGGVSYNKNDVCKKGIRILRGGNIQNMQVLLDEEDVFLPPEYYEEEKQVQPCDILIVASTGSKTVIGKAGHVDRIIPDTMIGAFLRICRPLLTELSGYLKIIFDSDFYRKHIRDLAQGTNINNVKESYITEFAIPLPPLAEQKRIIAKLEEIFPLIDRYEAAWNKLEEFNKRFPGDMQKSILQLAIQGKLVEQRPEEGAAVALKAALIQKKQEWVSAGAILKKADTKAFYGDEDLFDIPDTWEWVQLSDVSIIQEGAGIRKWQYRNDGTQILCVTNILDGSVDLDKKHLYISTEEYLEKYTHLTLKKGDIVTSCSGGSWGKIAFFDSDETLMLNTSTLRMRFFDDLADNNYLYYVCKSPFFKRQLELQLSGMQPNFGYAHYSRIVFPLPPLAEQRRIVAKLEEILPLCDRLK